MDASFVGLIVLFAATCALFALSVNAFRRIGELDARMDSLDRSGERKKAAPAYAPQAATVAPSTPRSASAPIVSSAPVFVASASTASTGSGFEARRAMKKPKIDWEMFAGGRFFSVVGALVLIVGVGLLMKYAFDQNWIGAPLRVLAGVVAGSALIATGVVEYAKRQTAGRSWFAEGVFGGGIGVLYVSGFSSFESYHLVPLAAAFAFMSLVTAVALGIALRYGSLPMALVGWAGGFVTPFAMGLNHTGQAGLASYLVMLDAGLAAVALVRRQWFALAPLALGSSYVVAATWYVTHLATASVVVSAIALAGLWLVFFASGLFGALRERAPSDPRAVTLRASVDACNAIGLWLGLRVVLHDEPTAFAVAQFAVCGAYLLAYCVVARRAAARIGLRAEYLIGCVGFLSAGFFTYVSHADLTLCYATLGIAFAICASRLARSHRFSAGREAAFAALSLYGLSVLSIAYVPHIFAFAHAPWSFGFDGADLSLGTIAVGAFSIDRLFRRIASDASIGFGLRQFGLVTVAWFEIDHFAAGVLASAFVGTAIVLALVHAILRSRGSAYAPNREPAYAALTMLTSAAVALVTSPDSFAPAFGALDVRFGSRDSAIVLSICASFVLDRIWMSEPRALAVRTIFRIYGLVAIAFLEQLHLRELGLATAYAFSAIGYAVFGRALRALRISSASTCEIAWSGGALLSLAWVVLLSSAGRFAYAGPFVELGFGRADSTLLAAIAAAAVLLRYRPSGVPEFVMIVLRLSIAFALGCASFVHAHGMFLSAALSVEAFTFALVGTSKLLRDVEIGALIVLAVSLLGALFDPSAWYATDIVRFAVLRDDRAVALLVLSIACIATAECYRRRSLLAAWTWRGARLAGVATIVLGLAAEVRDGFEHVVAITNPLSAGLREGIRNGESLTISGLLIAASIAIVSLGIARKIKEFRIASIALFDLTILKAFFVDLGSLAAAYRILSFIVLGLTLLVVSYFYQRLERGEGHESEGPTPETSAV